MSILKREIDFSGLRTQFRGVRGRHPAFWPILPQMVLLAAIFGATLVVAWALYWRGQLEELEAGERRELQLRAEFTEKLKQAVNLPALRQQKEQVSTYVNQLEKQLPNAAEMDALLSDINQAGVGRSLQFELFKPGEVVLRDYYAELPIKIKLTGRFADIAAFVSDVTNLARIVTLNDVDLQFQDKTGLLTLDATARTYRYLDQAEIAKVRREAARRKAAAGPGAAAPAAAAKKGAK